MSDLISRKAVINIIHKEIEEVTDYLQHDALIELEADLEEIPPVEAVPVVHGEWLDFYGDYSTAECDQCAECYEVSPDSEPKKEYFEAFKQCYNFCPNCGADMRKKV